MTAPRTARRPLSGPAFGQAVWLVAEREIGSKLRSKAFVISFAVLVIVALGLVVWGGFTASAGGSTTTVAVTPDTAAAVEDVDGLEVTQVGDREAAEGLVASGEVDAAVVGDDASPTGFAILAESEEPTSLVMQLAQMPTVEILDPAPGANPFGFVVALGLGILFMISAQLFGATIAQSVVEEKQTRVIELLISAIPARALLAGKVLGNTVLAMAQILVLAAIAVVGLTVTGQTELLAGVGAPLAWFALFFLLGFVLLASLFAGAAALVSRQEDIGATTTPIMMLVLAPYFLVIFFWDNPVVLTVMSYVPFSAPVGMPMRLFLGSAQWWEPLVSLVVLALACVAAIALGARLYENSLLRMGGRVKLREALSATGRG